MFIVFCVAISARVSVSGPDYAAGRHPCAVANGISVLARFGVCLVIRVPPAPGPVLRVSGLSSRLTRSQSQNDDIHHKLFLNEQDKRASYNWLVLNNYPTAQPFVFLHVCEDNDLCSAHCQHVAWCRCQNDGYAGTKGVSLHNAG